MPYQATIAARLSQFGATVVEFSLADDAGLMPACRCAHKWARAAVPVREIALAGAAAGVRLGNEWMDRQAEARARARVEIALDINDILTGARSELETQISAARFTVLEKSIADRIEIRAIK